LKSKLKLAAKEYFFNGLNIIPLHDKLPLIQWSKWQNQKQTETDFESLPWEQANGFALIGGSQLNNGLFICAIDFDVKNTSLEAQQKAQKIMKYLPITQIEGTVSGGQHWIYLSRRKPKTISVYHKNCALELLGENKLIIMAPSKGYRWLNDNTPTVVQDIETLFLEALEKEGLKQTSRQNQFWFNREDLAAKPYRGKHPVCIQKLLKGVCEGERNEAAIRLASYFVNFKKLSKQKTWKKLLEWNQKNSPPLPNNELETVLKSALEGGYVYGCSDYLLSQHCISENCPLAKPHQKVPKDVVEKEVERILASENPIMEIEKHLDNIIAGERENKIIIFILLLSGKFNNPQMKQMILLKGTEGSGKSTLMKIADFFKTKDVGRFSEHALDYTNLDGYEILRLKEIGNMDEEKQGVSTIKFLSSDDKGYIVEVTVRDKETGRFTTEEHRIPPITLISGTTRVILDPQFVRRNWILNPDESEEQTAKVLEWKARYKQELNEVALGIKHFTSLDYSREVLNQLVKQLEPCKIIVPFPKALTELLNNKVLRVRGDYDKIMAFLELYCFLNQNRLPKKEVNGKKIVFAKPQICLEALKIVQQPLINMTISLEKRTQKLIEILKKLGLTSKGTIITKDARNKIAVSMRRSERTIRSYLAEWETAGYLSSSEQKPKNYTLLYDLREIEEKISGISAKLDSADSLIAKMQEEAQKLLTLLSENGNQRDNEISLVGTIPTDENATCFIQAKK